MKVIRLIVRSIFWMMIGLLCMSSFVFMFNEVLGMIMLMMSFPVLFVLLFIVEPLTKSL